MTEHIRLSNLFLDWVSHVGVAAALDLNVGHLCMLHIPLEGSWIGVAARDDIDGNVWEAEYVPLRLYGRTLEWVLGRNMRTGDRLFNIPGCETSTDVRRIFGNRLREPSAEEIDRRRLMNAPSLSRAP